jgi:hypothetical protein
MRIGPIAGVLVTACVFAFAAGGCGGGGKSGTTTATQSRSQTTSAPAAHTRSPYVVRMRRLGSALAASIRLVANADSRQNTAPTTVAANLVKIQHALRRAADSLASIGPPAPIRSDHALLLRGVREYADELGVVIRRLRGGELTALKAIPTLRGVRDMQRATYAIMEKGYPIAG